jgi:hypothetical protein
MNTKILGIVVVTVLTLSTVFTIAGAIQEVVSGGLVEPKQGTVLAAGLGQDVDQKPDKAAWKYVCPFH